jgi:hypothetical protein
VSTFFDPTGHESLAQIYPGAPRVYPGKYVLSEEP